MNEPIIDWNIEANIEESLVSIVTPTFKRINLLAEAIVSVIEQTHKKIEHIIIGDSCPLLENNKRKLLKINPNLKIYNLKKETELTYGSAKISRVRNAGISMASGEFIAHLDDDNTWDTGHIEYLLNCFDRNPIAAVAHSYRKLFLNDGTSYTYPYHPWSSDIQTAKLVYETYKRMGIYEPNSHLMRDRVTFHEERDCTLDTNELMVRTQIHKRFPFLVNFSESMMNQQLGEDDVFCEMIYNAGYRFVFSGEYTLNFRVGGRFTEELLCQIKDKS